MNCYLYSYISNIPMKVFTFSLSIKRYIIHINGCSYFAAVYRDLFLRKFSSSNTTIYVRGIFVKTISSYNTVRFLIVWPVALGVFLEIYKPDAYIGTL